MGVDISYSDYCCGKDCFCMPTMNPETGIDEATPHRPFVDIYHTSHSSLSIIEKQLATLGDNVCLYGQISTEQCKLYFDIFEIHKHQFNDNELYQILLKSFRRASMRNREISIY